MTGPVLDSHLHLIDPSHLDYPWIRTGDLLDQTWGARRFAAEALRVTAAIVVEAGAAPRHARREISWVLAEASRHQWIRGMVVQLAVEDASTLAARLTEFRGDQLVAGVRRNLQDERPGYLADPDLRAGVRELSAAGLPFDACVRSWQLTELAGLAAACRGTVIVLDHLGKPRCGADLTVWRQAMSALAALPNVHCKLSGLATEAAAGASRDDMITALRAALDAFGARRCLYGGDWPVCTQATSPDAWLDLVLAAMEQGGASETERQDVLTGTALRTYRLRPAAIGRHPAASEGASR
jgi:L-fuconolactonase